MDELKRAAALAAVDLLPTKGIIGIGSGTTLAYAIEEIGRRVRVGQMQIVGVPTSYQARMLGREYGIPLQDSMDVSRIDVTIDGADEVDPHGNLIKGAGAAHCIEKVVASSSKRMIVVVDESKIVERLGRRFPVPVDVFPAGLSYAMRCLRDLGGEVAVRESKGKIGPVVSDLGNVVVDVKFDEIEDAAALDRRLNAIAGVVGHGLFLGLASEAVVAKMSRGEPAVEILQFKRMDAEAE